MIARCFLFLALLYCAVISLHAQQRLDLTLERTLDLAYRQSYIMQNARQEYLASKNQYEAQALVTATSVDLSLRLPEYNESLANQFNPLTQRYEFYKLQSTLMRSTLAINQPVALTGGTISLSGDFFHRNQQTGPAGTSQIIKDYFSYFQVGIRQPILSTNTLKIQRKQAFLQLDQNEAEFLREQCDITYRVTDAFFTAFKLTEQERISAEQVKQNEESYATAKGKYTAGLIPEVEMLQTEIDLVTSRNLHLNDRTSTVQSLNALKVMLNIPLETDLHLSAEVAYVPQKIDSSLAVRKALENRAEVLNAKRNVELRSMDIDLASSSRRLRFDVTAGYGLNRNDSEIETLFRDFDRTRSVALEVSIPLFDWGRHAREVESAEARYKSAELRFTYTGQQIRQEILDLLSRVAMAESRIQVLSKSVEMAQKSYEISLDRFRAGTITRNDLAQAQQRLTTTKLNNLVALIDYRLGIADLTRRTLWNFEKNEPVKVLLLEFDKN